MSHSGFFIREKSSKERVLEFCSITKDVDRGEVLSTSLLKLCALNPKTWPNRNRKRISGLEERLSVPTNSFGEDEFFDLVWDWLKAEMGI